MILDEVIAHEKELAKEIYIEAMLCHANPDDGKLDDCIERGKYHEQIAEWLEELKSYRASVFSGDMTQTMLKEEYCKAVDDFAEKLNAKCDGMIKDKWNSNVAPISWAEAYADFKDDINDIAEQLKAGVSND